MRSFSFRKVRGGGIALQIVGRGGHGYHYQTAVVVVVVVVNGVRASVAHVIIRNGIPPPRRHHRWPIVKHLFCFAMPLTFDYQKTREGGRLLNRLNDLWLLSLSLCLFA